MTLPHAERSYPEGVSPTRRHTLPRLPALDGLRAVALGAVLLFHADYVWAKGGHLGVTAFFTLSGFLITALLLLERDATGSINFIAFWGRRARRLVPAALVCLALVVVYVAASPELSFDGLLGDAAASVTWLANWRFVAEGEAYSDMFSAPSPFQHFWSLAIEEQFYFGLPIVAALVFGLRQGRARRLPLALVGVGVIVASSAAAMLFHEPGEAPLRAYYGTDARIAEPLVGVVLALVLIGPTGLRRLSVAGRRVLDTAGVLALGGLAVLGTTLSPWDARLYEGGFLATALLAAVVVAAATQRGGVVDRMLSAPLLVGIGRISYGAYLFHWPIYLWMTEHRTGLEGSQLLGLRVGVTLTLAAMSYLFIELPIRERRLPVQVGALAWPTATVGLLAALVLVLAIPLPLTTQSDELQARGGLSGSPRSAAPTPKVSEGHAAAAAGSTPNDSELGQAVSGSPATPSMPEDQPDPAAPDGGDASPAPTTAPPPPPDGEPPVRVAVLGDSLGDNLGLGFEIWSDRNSEVVVTNMAIDACPISRGGTRQFPNGHEWGIKDVCPWWEDPNSEQSRQLRIFDPDVVVVQDSFAILPDRKLEEWRRYRSPGEPLFDTWLVSEYDEFVNTVSDQGAAVVMTNAVCADFERHDPWSSLDDAYERIDALNQRVFPLLTSRAKLADLNTRICPDGEFSNTVEGYENARPDGFHLTDDAAAALVERWLGPIAVDAAKQQQV